MTRRTWLNIAVRSTSLASALSQGITQSVQQRRHLVPIVDAQGQVVYRFLAFSGVLTFDLGGGERLEMACIPGGTGIVGANEPPPDVAFLQSTPVRSVSIQPFCLGVFEVTRGQWLRVSQLPRVRSDLPVWFAPPRSEAESLIPMEEISFLLAEEFCARLSRLFSMPFRLPSEAEWEYAARAGTLTKFHFGDTLGPNPIRSEVFILNRFAPVGSKNAPNRFGLHDMHGSVAEWCADWEHTNYTGAPMDGSAWLAPSPRPNFRMFRGSILPEASVASRTSFPAGGDRSLLGFRVALTYDHRLYDPRAAALIQAASYVAGPISPGDILSIYGERIGPLQSQSATPDGSGRLPVSLAGVEVYFDDTPAPLLYASTVQVNVVAPFDLQIGRTVRVVVKNAFQSAHPIDVLVAAARPAVFTTDGSGRGVAAALNQDLTLHSRENAARRGSVIVLFGSGFGVFSPDVADGQVVTGVPPRVSAPVRATVGGVAAAVDYAGAAPGLVAGAVQLNLRLSSNTPVGEQPVVLYAHDVPSQEGVTVHVS